MIKNILVIRFRRVGDSVLSMALCHSLKLSFPEAKVHFVINSGIAPLYEGHPDVDEVIPFTPEECKGLRYVRRVWQVMHATHYDVIIDMRSTVKTCFFSLFSLSTPYRIGRRKAYNRGLHNFRLDNPKGADRVKTNLNLLTPLGKEGELKLDRHFPLYISEKERSDFRQYMQAQGIDFSRPVVLTACATRIIGKEWPQERMAEVLRRLIENHPDVQIIFNYAGEVETAAARQLYEMLDHSPNIFLNVEAGSLRQLCALCANSDFFFGNEGGPRHIAQAFSVPSFAIYPPGIRKEFWLPGKDERYQGISPDDYVEREQQKNLSYAQRFAILTIDEVWKGLEHSYTQFVKHE